ncbi:MAG: hypothetical protein C0482_23765 [Gordonia sp.]|nr:hypothetical protein [Gordonia sp. (in: high G+C Gram-positive bacteria)]
MERGTDQPHEVDRTASDIETDIGDRPSTDEIDALRQRIVLFEANAGSDGGTVSRMKYQLGVLEKERRKDLYGSATAVDIDRD